MTHSKKDGCVAAKLLAHVSVAGMGLLMLCACQGQPAIANSNTENGEAAQVDTSNAENAETCPPGQAMADIGGCVDEADLKEVADEGADYAEIERLFAGSTKIDPKLWQRPVASAGGKKVDSFMLEIMVALLKSDPSIKKLTWNMSDGKLMMGMVVADSPDQPEDQWARSLVEFEPGDHNSMTVSGYWTNDQWLNDDFAHEWASNIAAGAKEVMEGKR